MDENWICVTGSGRMGTGEQIAKEIQTRVLSEIGLSVSIGVSFNKVIAKLGSDHKIIKRYLKKSKENSEVEQITHIEYERAYQKPILLEKMDS